MAGNALRTLWAEPRSSHPPVRVWRDRALVAVVVVWSALEAMSREDVAWRPVALTVVVIALTLVCDAPVLRPRCRSRSER